MPEGYPGRNIKAGLTAPKYSKARGLYCRVRQYVAAGLVRQTYFLAPPRGLSDDRQKFPVLLGYGQLPLGLLRCFVFKTVQNHT